MKPLGRFVRESNRIERIYRDPLPNEIHAHERFLELTHIAVGDLEAFVSEVQPGAILRRLPNLNVSVGGYVAPPGGPTILLALDGILIEANSDDHSYWVHQKYEHLHPFTDGNGRSGRVLWLWMMSKDKKKLSRALGLGFLHSWYYESLSVERKSTRKVLNEINNEEPPF